MNHLKPKWTLNFNGCDNRQLFKALQNADMTDEAMEAANGATRAFDDDPDSPMNCSIEISDLWHLRQILAATEKVSCDWGVVLHVSADDKDVATFAGCLGQPDGKYTQTSANVSYWPTKTHAAIEEKLREAESLVSDSRQMLRVLPN